MGDILETLAEALAPALAAQNARRYGIGEKHNASGVPSTAMLHGPGGLLSYPGVDPVLFHTVVGNRGILGALPTSPSLFTDPTYYTITGVQDDVGSEKNTVCENAPTSGLIKGCLAHSVFGRYERATQEVELNRLGQRRDRADPMDLTLIGSPIHTSGLFTGGAQSPAVPGDLLRSEIARLFWTRNISMHRLLNLQLWQGNPANNSAGGGYKELTGLRILINTGYVDAENGTRCPSMDSDLKDFNYARVNTNGPGLVNAISYLYHTRFDLAERTGVLPVRWVLAMRPELFWEITAIWPCSYLSYRCDLSGIQNNGGAALIINGTDQVAMRDEMRNGKYLLIDGVRIEVIVDDGIPMATNTTNANVTSGCAASDIFLIPMSVIGGRAVTFLEYFDYTNPDISQALGNMILGRVEGAFLTWPRQLNQCVVWQTKIEPRLVLRTPWLAGRLQNVQYCPLQFAREPFPDDPYFVDGGRTYRTGPSFYELWRQTQAGGRGAQ